MDAAGFGKLVRKRAVQGKLNVPAPALAKFDLLDPYFQNVARFGAFDVDRAGQKMRSRSSFGIRQDLSMFVQDCQRLVVRRIIRLP
jgi:hypothetical protein